MHSEAIEIAQHWLISLLVIFLIGTLGGKLANTLRVPDVVIYIVIGLLLGHGVFSLILISPQSPMNQMILIFGASLIIFHGGMTVSVDVLRKVWISIILLSTTGLVITAFITALGAYWIFHIPFLLALLLGALLASTDPAALIPIFQRFPVRAKVAQTVVAESAFTDATGAIMTTVVLGMLTTNATMNGWGILGSFLWLTLGGILVGVIVGGISVFLVSENDRGLLREFTPMVAVVTVLAAYLLADHWLHASGFMAVFVAGIMMSNGKLLGLTVLPKEEQEMHKFVDAISLKFRMLIFVLLGSQVDFHVLQTYGLWALLVAVVFMVIARPATVLASLLPDRRADWSRKEILFFFWTRETGVIPVALVGIVASAQLPGAGILSAVTFVCVLFTLVLQAGTTPLVAKKLGLFEGQPTGEAE